jgi:hypothetical protein
MENTIDKITNFIFPAKKALDKAAKPATPAAPSTDTSYIQGIVNQRMKEKMDPPKNPLVNAIKKSTPRSKK